LLFDFEGLKRAVAAQGARKFGAAAGLPVLKYIDGEDGGGMQGVKLRGPVALRFRFAATGGGQSVVEGKR
jgi:hypothetical protein